MSAPSSNPNSNKFRAEPFVNLTAESLSVDGSNGNGITSGNNSRRPSAAFSAADGAEREMIQDEHDELMDDEEEDEERLDSVIPSSRMRTRIPNRGDSNRQSLSSGPHLHTASSISDLQRGSIASTTSSTSSNRRSSYDPNEPGVLEKIHTGQGKSKRKPISVQQWKHMTTFKIRPPTATEAASSSVTNTSVPTPVSVDPYQQYSPLSSDTLDRKMDSETGFVFIPEGGSANSVSVAPPIPRAVPIVMPPATLTYASGVGPSSKPPRKRARREEPNDPNIQVFYHDDVAPTNAVLYGERGHSVEPPPTSPPHHLAPISPLIPEPTMHVKTPSPPLAAVPAPLPTLPPVPQQVFKSQTISIGLTPIPLQPPSSHSPFYPVKYDPAEQVFTLPESEPLERGGPPPRKWVPVHRGVRTIGGGSWVAATWITEGGPAVPVDAPAGFVPGSLHSGGSGGFGFGFGSSAGGSLQGLSALSGVSSLALGTGVGKGTDTGTGTGTATPTLGTAGGLTAPAKRVKKVKSDASIGGGTNAAASVAGGGRKKPAAGAAATKRGKKGTGTAGTATPVTMEPPPVAITRAVSDTEMRDA